MMNIIADIINSWENVDGTENTLDEILAWVQQRCAQIKVEIRKVNFSYDGFWYYDSKDGYIRNKNNSFFQLAGYQEIEGDQIINEQPIIIQDEIGYLGIICKKINGVLNFLMQAKIEPGNINKIQISPTIQATKSNFTRRHGGKSPAYLEYFVHAADYEIIADQVQSEQSSRFYKKRNRNIIICVNDDIELTANHKWMTLGQIKKLMEIDNLVNMDTRTVLSCIPFPEADISETEKKQIKECFSDKPLYRSIFEVSGCSDLHYVFNKLNDLKMYKNEHSRLVPIKSLKSWCMDKKEIFCKTPYDFKVIYCYIEIEGREVTYWEQPLIEASGSAVLGLFTCVQNGIRKFMVCVKHELGCFDVAELGPIVQLEPTNPRNELNYIEQLFLNKLSSHEGVLKDVVLSEEGGRFYHEENRNVIIEIDVNEICQLPPGYFWLDFATLNLMIQFNNILNIQLRNLLSLIDL